MAPSTRLKAEAVRQLVENVHADRTAPKASEEEKTRAALLATLDALGGLTVPEDGILFEGDKLIAPAQYAGDIPGLITFLKGYEKSQNSEHEISRTFDYRPYDGANAFQNVLKRIWGTSGVGKVKWTFFGPQKPELLSVHIDVDKTIQIPWGTVAYEPLEATFELGWSRDREKGIIFSLSCSAPKKHSGRIEALFQLIEKELKENSIYRGKAITAASPEPGFVRTDWLKPESVVYSQATMDQLDANVWAGIKYTDQYRQHKIRLKRAVLLEGPHGTGKSLAGILTAQHAVRNGWTFILVRPEDDVLEALKTAQLYAPAVVHVEDVERIAGTQDGQTANFVSKVLDALDAVGNKHAEILTVFTTNYVGQIHRGALRPGRLDAVVTVGGLDEQGFERLVRMSIAPELLGDINFEVVAEAFKGFLPSFVVEAATRAVRFAIARGQGAPQPVSTADLVNSANSLRPQLKLHEDAPAVEGPAPIDMNLQRLLGRALAEAVDSDYLDQDWLTKMRQSGILVEN